MKFFEECKKRFGVVEVPKDFLSNYEKLERKGLSEREMADLLIGSCSTMKLRYVKSLALIEKLRSK